nr:PAS domain-containing protein [uncultured Caproiciproducens sp.]
MTNILEYYKKLIPFLGQAIGSYCEVALQDCQAGCIVAIANSHISGRQVGSPLTDLARQIIDNEAWREQDYIASYEGRSQDGRLLSSSTYFIKENDQLLGMICINCDTSCFSQLSHALLELGGLKYSGNPVLMSGVGGETAPKETFFDDLDYSINSTIAELFGDHIPDQFSQEDRITIIRKLSDKGVFLVKGCVGRVSHLLRCSDASVYRYLSIIGRESEK